MVAVPTQQFFLIVLFPDYGTAYSWSTYASKIVLISETILKCAQGILISDIAQSYVIQKQAVSQQMQSSLHIQLSKG